MLAKLKNSLARTRQRLVHQLEEALSLHSRISPELYDELEEILITTDVGLETSGRVLEELKARVKESREERPEMVREFLKEILVDLLSLPVPPAIDRPPLAILVVGVNGVGKTTSIAKLAAYYKAKGCSCLLVAADTFRAAAGEQLAAWGERLGVEIVRSREGSDPGAVVFDGLAAANARRIDVVIIDTAGRLHTKANLMAELEKVYRVCTRNLGDRNLLTLLVLDAGTGQNGLNQARVFQETVGVDGIILAKLDGTARGGIVLAVADQLRLPVVWVGTGEQPDDLRLFDAREFVTALFDET
ncbi:MAG: signal recognition particle-docking protein FtsY [Firmicutes bacterium]|nr:signal recognition particle-docking protein FtsY [Bacillota bacterium]